jgi:acetylornithine deacetylase/succinyl-diaminopimelate desuccinylase-like protein
LKGDGSKRPLILLNHIDVVPAQASDWTHDPFSGEIHDGEIWGRGALDMKGMGIAELVSMIQLKRAGKPLKRDVIFLATPDEEVGGEHGAQWFTQNHPELVKDAEFLLNEGYFIEADDKGKPKYWGVDISEKSVLWLRLTARGNAGHGSMPMADSAPNRLTRALAKVVNEPPGPMVLPAVREFFQSIAPTEAEPLRSYFANIDESVKDPKKYDEILNDKLRSAMLRNTVSLTVLKAGYKTNVIPAEAQAELDCRLLPGVTKEQFIEEIKAKLGDPSIEIVTIDNPRTDASPMNTELYSAIKAVAAEEQPGIPVVPVVVPWFTDSHWFRNFGTVAYGFEPMEVDAAHLASMHGKNERVPVKNFKDAVRRLHKIVSKVVY